MKSDSQNIRDAYDSTPYVGEAFAITHPDNLNLVATLAGLSPTAVHNCRVLDIGCANGRNLLPMAIVFPASKFIGIDFSPVEIADAENFRRSLGLHNVEFRCADLMDFDSVDQFDYIIAHGFYSWVPGNVRRRLWEITSRLLAPQGLLFISYNTLPGWHFKRAARDLMLFHNRSISSPPQRLAAGREILELAASDSPSTPGYKEMMRISKQSFEAQSSQGAVHDDLGVINDPVYFQDFISEAGRFGFGYAGPAIPSSGLSMLTPILQSKISQMSDDPIVHEQYLDFICGRIFRSSILARSDMLQNTSRKKGVDVMSDLYVAGWMTLDQSSSVTNTIVATFTLHRSQQKFLMHDRRLVNPLQAIGAAWPQAISFTELSASMSNDTDATTQLRNTLFKMYEMDLIELHTRRLDEIGNLSGMLITTALVRAQAKSGENVVSLRHQVVPANPLLRKFIELLDGSRDRHALLRDFQQMINSGELTISSASGTPTRKQIQELIDRLLQTVSDWSLLVA